MLVRCLAVLTCALATLPAAAHATAPTVSTDSPKNVGRTTATLVATVTAGGAATSVRFDLGKTTEYGLSSSSRDVAADATNATVEIPVSSLEENTVYHARVVATNADGTTTGNDVAFKTLSSTSPPGATTGTAQNVTGSGARLTGTVTLRGQQTFAHFEYGGQRTPEVDLGTGTGPVPFAADVTGLAPDTRYSFRLVVRSAAGSARGARRYFTTARAVSGATLNVSPGSVKYGGAIRATGRLTGARVRDTRVAVEISSFQFIGQWRQVGLDKEVPSSGRYEFTIAGLLSHVQVRVVTRSGLRQVYSRTLFVSNTMKVGFIPPARRGRRIVARGSVRPATQGSTATLERRSPSGRWRVLARQPVLVRDGRARYRFELDRPRRGADMRVIVSPGAANGGKQYRGISRPRFVKGR